MGELQISEKLQADIDEVREGLQYGEEAYCHAFERVVFAMNAVQMRPFVDEVNGRLFQQAMAALESDASKFAGISRKQIEQAAEDAREVFSDPFSGLDGGKKDVIEYLKNALLVELEKTDEEAVQAMQWQPIETAPTETPITVFYNGEIYHNVPLEIGGFLGWLRKSEFGADVPLDEDFLPTHWVRTKPPK